MRKTGIVWSVMLLAAILWTQGCARVIKQTPQNEAAPTDGTTAMQKALTADDTETAQATDAAVSETAPPTQALGQTLREQIDAAFRKYGTVGAQVAVIRDGEVYAQYSFGCANRSSQTAVQAETKFRCASLSKLITAMTVMTLQEAGTLDLQTDVGTYLGYGVRNPRFPDTPITCRMLMTHTSSIVDSAAFLDSRNAQSSVPLQTLLTQRTSYASSAPGAQYSYSNFGVAVLADAAECAAGQDFETLAQERLFRPLGLDAAYLAADLRDPSRTADLYDAGGRLRWSAQRQMQETKNSRIGQTHHLYQGNLTVSATDYAKLLCVLLNDGQYAQTTVLQPQSVRQILSVQYSGQGVAQGYCVKRLDHVVEGRSMWCHTGINYGVHTSFAVDPSDRSGVVVFTSGADAQKAASELFDVCTDVIRLCYAEF